MKIVIYSSASVAWTNKKFLDDHRDPWCQRYELLQNRVKLNNKNVDVLCKFLFTSGISEVVQGISWVVM